MKKTTIAMLTLTVGIMAASCQKEIEAPETAETPSGPMVINAISEGMGVDTKVEMAYKYDLLWQKDDHIFVTDGSVNDTFTLTGGEGTTKGTFTQDGSVSFTGEVEAYYPQSLVTDNTLVWPEVQTNDQTVPMYSSKAVSGNVEDFNFTSLGSVLQIVFNTTQAGVTLKSIEIKDGSKTMSGEFTVNNGVAEITATDNAGIILNLGEGKALGKGANYFNIAVPAGNYQDLTLVFTATDGTKCKMTKGKVNIACNTVGRLTLTGETFKPDVPEGALSGEFSVSNDDGTTIKQVHFSQGNLTYNIITSTWAFYEHQYDCATGYDPNLISLFTWGYDATKSIDPDGTSYVEGHETHGESFNKNEDWGYVFGGESSVWRTLTKDEWTYLFNTTGRMVNGKPCYSNAVSGVIIESATYKGVFLYPDNYNGEVVSSGSMTWDQINAAGIVFLPAAGFRNGSKVVYVGTDDFYWSSTAKDSNDAYGVRFYSNGVLLNCEGYRNSGFSVRLITESK